MNRAEGPGIRDPIPDPRSTIPAYGLASEPT